MGKPAITLKQAHIIDVIVDQKNPPKSKTEIAKRSGTTRPTVDRALRSVAASNEIARRKRGQLDCATALVEGNQGRLLELVDQVLADPNTTAAQKVAVLGSTMKLGLDIRDRSPASTAHHGPDWRDRYQAARSRFRSYLAGLKAGSNGESELIPVITKAIDYIDSQLSPTGSAL